MNLYIDANKRVHHKTTARPAYFSYLQAVKEEVSC